MPKQLETYQQLLKQYWGYDAFRPTQEKIILSYADGKDTLGLMPTGGGKSITFQVPAMAEKGVCLVVTPLIALMKDQVMGLRKKGIQAEAIYSGMRRSHMVTLLDNCALGGVKFLYVSPERLSTQLFLDKLPHLHIKWLVIDEAHCISQWGYDFRPSYLKIAEIRRFLPNIPVLALTATATPQVVEDIQHRLQFEEPNVIQMSFERKNLVYYVRETEDKPKGLLTIFNKMQGCGIVYVRSRNKTQEIAEFLSSYGITATHYHAGLTAEDKEEKQQSWMQNKVRVMVATNAFGMGIDKPDVRLVAHIDTPDSLEAYYQEAGRAGRDGEKSYAILLYNKSDEAKLSKQLTNSFPPKDYIAKVYQSLGNYYQIAVNSGLNRQFDFDLIEFCARFKYSRVQAHYAIKILHNAGYIYLNDQSENTSRIHIYAGKDELFRFQEENQQYEDFIKFILRTYTGLFSSFVYISENFLAKKTNLTRQQVYDTLLALNKFKLIKYIPGKSLPQLQFTQERIPNEYFNVTKEVYEELLDRYRRRIAQVIYYASDKMNCRSLTLMRYFGEKNGKACGQCDVCRRNHQEMLSDEMFEKIANHIKGLLKNQEMMAENIVALSPYPETKVLKTLRFMMDNRDVIVDRDGEISLP